MIKSSYLRIVYLLVAFTIPATASLTKTHLPQVKLPYATWQAASYNNLSDVRPRYKALHLSQANKNRYTYSKTSVSQHHPLGIFGGRFPNHRSRRRVSRMVPWAIFMFRYLPPFSMPLPPRHQELELWLLRFLLGINLRVKFLD
jgi:hypothetical protein